MYTIIRHAANDNDIGITKYFKTNKVNELFRGIEFCLSPIQSKFGSYFSPYCDETNDIIFYFELEKLPNNMVWVDNLTDKIIKSLSIDVFLTDDLYNINYEYVKENIKFDNYNNTLLFKNLNFETRRKMSKYNVDIVLPIKLKYPFFKSNLGDRIFVNLELNFDNLVDNNINYKPSHIKCKIQTFGSYNYSKK
jgi:hypothetical protein